jgi:hypothetical protein
MLDYLIGHGLKRLEWDTQDYFDRVRSGFWDEGGEQARPEELLACRGCNGLGFRTMGFFETISLNQVTGLPMVNIHCEICPVCKGSGQTKRRRRVYDGTMQNFYKVQVFTKHDVARIRFKRGAWSVLWEPCVSAVLRDNRMSVEVPEAFGQRQPSYKGQSIFVLKMFDQRVDGQLSCDLAHSEQDICKRLAQAIRTTPKQKLTVLEEVPEVNWHVVRHIEEAPVDDCRCGVCYAIRNRQVIPAKPEPLQARDIIADG